MEEMFDPDDLEWVSDLAFMLTQNIRAALPAPPVDAAARLCCTAAADGVDRISRLPECILRNIVVAHAPCLERLLLWHPCGIGALAYLPTLITIIRAPRLHTQGFLVPGVHRLQIGPFELKYDTEASQDQTHFVPSVQMLAVHVKLGAYNQALMLPRFLRCFPNVKTLYIQSDSSTAHGVKLGHQFREEEAAPIECIQEHLTRIVFREFRERSETEFLKFVIKRAQVLERLEVFLTPQSSDMVAAKLLVDMSSAMTANKCCNCKLVILRSPFPEEGNQWCFKRSFNLSIEDPFDVSKCPEGKCLEH